MGEVGRYEDALKHAQEALEISHRLADKIPARFDEAAFNTTCLIYFLRWICDYSEMNGDLKDLSIIPETIPKHRRPLFIFFSNFVKACISTELTTRGENFKQVLFLWKDLSLVSQNTALAYWLCAVAWCKTFIPISVEELDWQTNWQKYKTQHQGNLPQWMQEVARRLGFMWPK